MRHWREALPNPILAVALRDWVEDFGGTLAGVCPLRQSGPGTGTASAGWPDCPGQIQPRLRWRCREAWDTAAWIGSSGCGQM